ncbi:energy transducer TonB [Roseovarius faecimaris]|uniref:Energy transducer TonB n=1 Tax=Roseovarius faecimaris TaxID=2494550 RepID=A0A6I6IT08_9RHOB|nr:energy transducer TonB [Roseovarius faecimaris]QGX99274.1 energy transducer TonB [Roseovarius faecimaris]
MNTGQYISGAGHIGLIGWAILGGVFTAEPLPFEVTEVTAISSEEYAALIAPQQSPEATSEIVTPEAPEPEEETPDIAATPDTAPEQVEPEVAEPATVDDTPEVTEPAPLPEAEVSDDPPVLEPPSEDVAVLLPDDAVRPQPRPAERVAPEPVAQPEPDVRIDDVTQPETAPDEAAEIPREETEQSAEEEATTEIVTEAEEPAQSAPTRSVRPKTRPSRPQPTEEPAESSQPDTAVNDALAEALGNSGGETQRAPSGPPLTAGEKDALRVAVEKCWNVGSLSSEALQTTVVVSVQMAEDGKPNIGTIRMIGSEGGSGTAARQAFEAARRAIIRCGSSGFNLPRDKFDHWRDIEMTFNPEKMRIK